MDTNYLENNYLTLVGKVASEKKFSHENSYENEKNKLILTVFAKDIEKVEDEEEVENVEETENNEAEEARKEAFKKDYITNEVVLIGYICKKPVYRQTPFGREIADLLLAVNRAYNKSDYIPSIAWGRNARFCQNLEVGTEVKIVGRVQSRNYEKKLEDGTVLKKVAYEVSIGSLEVVKESENNSEETTETASVEENTVQEAM